MVLSSALAAAMVGNRDIKVQYRRINLDEKLFVIVTSHDVVVDDALLARRMTKL